MPIYMLVKVSPFSTLRLGISQFIVPPYVWNSSQAYFLSTLHTMTVSWLSFIIPFILSITSIYGQKLYIPALTLEREGFHQDPERAVSASETFFFDQTLDHFSYTPQSYATFKQRYFIECKFWGGANSTAPIFVYLGPESELDGPPKNIGFLRDNAAQFQALLVYIEHRYYGQSIPLGMSFEEALENADIRGYFSSAQALADYVAIIMHVKREWNSIKSPVIVVGGSYGGMLASWLRLKYPHVALGALASSAPVLYFENMTPQDAYYSVVAKDFKEYWSVVESGIQEPPVGMALTDPQKAELEARKLKDLKKKYQGSVRVKRAQLQALRRDFETLAMKDGESVTSYCARTMEISNKMRFHEEGVEVEVEEGEIEEIEMLAGILKPIMTNFKAKAEDEILTNSR
ncbi:prolyl carboxy peptidase like protein 5-like [Eucalyptus grandis]|uniref:prolyl carboxy peptidase like protein 5-like n=1 Tax=Eucalyptus grandis TaxID=71139 RepID=UPI00192EEF12|nr:prolyl carboxy peptidase like protein 5-like [Eucalyptus grandis]